MERLTIPGENLEDLDSRKLPKYGVLYWKLNKYEDLEEQGKLLKLPCAVGDDVWYISERVEKQGRKKVEISFVDHGVVDNITLGHMMIPQITVCNGENVWTTFDSVEDFGKTVFPTREEAEATLKELEEGKGNETD